MATYRFKLIALPNSFSFSRVPLPAKEGFEIKLKAVRTWSSTTNLEIPDITFVYPPMVVVFNGEPNVQPDEASERMLATVVSNFRALVPVDGGANVKYCSDYINEVVLQEPALANNPVNAMLDLSAYPSSLEMIVELLFDYVKVSELERVGQAFRDMT